TDIPAYKMGDRVPDMAVATLDGSQFQARDPDKKRNTVWVFMSPWCESYLEKSRPKASSECRAVREQVESLVRSDSPVRWVGIASGIWATRDDLRDYQTQYKTQLPLALDDSGK